MPLRLRASKVGATGHPSRWLGVVFCLVMSAALLAPAAEVGAAPRDLRPPDARRTGWPKFRFDLANTGYNPYERTIGPGNVVTLAPAWQAETGTVRGSIVLHAGTIYVAGTTYEIPVSTIVTAMDARSGRLRWQIKLHDTSTLFGLGYAEGRIYVGTDDYQLRALDARTGQILWDAFAGGIPSAPAVAAGTVYITATDGYVHAFDAATGTERWKYFPGRFVGSVTPALVGGVLYAEDSVGLIFALDATTGTLLWSFQGECCGNGLNVSGPAVVDGVLYVELSNMTLYALDAATGSLIWEVSTGPLLYNAPPSPAVAGGVAYVGSNGEIQAYATADGTRLWSTSISDDTGSPSLANGIVYAPGGTDGTFWALDAFTGAALWSFAAGIGVGDGSDIVANATVYVGSFDGYLYSFKLP